MTPMTPRTRIGALDIAEAIADRIGSYVHMEFIEFLAADADRIQCWYMNSGGEGPSFGIDLHRVDGGWLLDLTQFAPGTKQTVELP